MTVKPMTPEERTAAKHLIAVWWQYGTSSGGWPSSDPIFVEHQNMGIGEEAGDWLEDRGLAVDQGYGLVITPAGMALVHEDDAN